MYALTSTVVNIIIKQMEKKSLLDISGAKRARILAEAATRGVLEEKLLLRIL